MKKKNYLTLLLFLILSIALSGGTQAKTGYKWKFVKSKNGCKIYSSDVAGKDYIAAKCVSVINAPMDVIGMVLRDIPSFPVWMYDCKATKVLKVVNEKKDSFIFYLHQHIPLLSDRDMVLKTYVKLNYKKGWAYIGVRSTNEYSYPKQGSCVRMPGFHSKWFLEWVDKDHTRATFMIDPDLGSGIPTMIANSRIKTIPYKSMLGIKKMVKKQKYINSAKKSKYRKLINQAIKGGYIK